MVCFSELGWDADEEEGEPSPLATRADPSPSPEETVEYHELQRILLEAIDGLPSKLRLVVLLRYAHQLSFAEIGQRLHMPASTAKSYFYRARPLLRATLTAQGHADPPVAVLCRPSTPEESSRQTREPTCAGSFGCARRGESSGEE
jgi:RNA polymerase sigma-70 factor (ECF subfamily)